MALDPTLTVATSVHAGPGVYALLLGSGVSRSAEVPTGWEVVLDIIKKLAALAGEEPNDLVAWYRGLDGDDPDYSRLLEQVAPTGPDRRNLLEGYFEPSPDEQERGAKVPTQAHRAVACLVAGGWVKVIVTTNFDRLLESALRAEGLEPVVIDSPEAATGAIPLAHTRCTVVKLHGDYLNPDIKNTVEELVHYEQSVDALLDRIFDEYGLIVCGWSGEWDHALRQALLRTPNRRYATFWTHRGGLGEQASKLVAHRGAVEVPISGADEFFAGLAAKVEALDSMGHTPLSTDLAVAELKRYLPDPGQRIRLHDLVMNEVAASLDLGQLEMHGPGTTADPFLERMALYERQSDRLLPLLATLSYFADRQDHDQLIASAVERLVEGPREQSGLTTMLALQLYPALLAMYAIGLGSLAAGHLGRLEHALAVQMTDDLVGERSPVAANVQSWHQLNGQICNIALVRDSGTNRRTPVSDYLHDHLREALRTVVPNDDHYDRLFDELEVVLGIVTTSHNRRGPIGRFVWRHQREDFVEYVALTHWDDLASLIGDAGDLNESVEDFKEQVAKSGLSW